MRESTIDAAVDTVSHRDSTAIARGLDAWLADRYPGARVEGISAPGGSGASSELFYLQLSGMPGQGGATVQGVLRLASAWSVYPVVDLGLQAACMTAAREWSEAPVPRVYAVETEACAGLEAPFLLMERLSGDAAPDLPSYVVSGWIHGLSQPDQGALWRHGIEAIASLHRTDVTAAGIAHARLPAAGGNALERMLAYWTMFLQHVEQHGEVAELRESVAWLHREQPAGMDDDGLVWGDASLRNMLFRDLRPVALLDFEFAHVGLRVFDIAFYALMDHVMARGFANGAPRLAGFPGIHDTLDYYEQVSGRAVPCREYLLRMALTYMALSTTRVYQRLALQQRIDIGEVAENPPLVILRAALDGEPLPD